MSPSTKMRIDLPDVSIPSADYADFKNEKEITVNVPQGSKEVKVGDRIFWRFHKNAGQAEVIEAKGRKCVIKIIL